MQQSAVSNNIQTTEALHPDPVKTDTVTGPVSIPQRNPQAGWQAQIAAPENPGQKNIPAQQNLSVTATTPGFVIDAAPIIPPDPYPIQHGTRINATPQNNPLDRVPDFTRTYTLSGNATGMIINVMKGPLIISFVVNPLYDCLENPESCRGNLAASVNRPWMTITVRDNQTLEIVAEDGYGGKYSSDTGRYTFTNTGTDVSTGIQTTSTTTPGPRYIAIYKEGQYHVTLTGAYLDVTLSVATGASPLASDTQSSSSSPAPARTLPPEYLRYLQQSGGV